MTQIYSLTVLEVQKSKIAVLTALHPFWRLQGRICFPVFSASRGYLHPLVCGLFFHLQNIPFQPLLLSSHLLLLPLTFLPLSNKDPCNYMERSQIIQDNLNNKDLKILNLETFAKSLLPCKVT